MAEFPALPLFTDAYLADTTHLTTLEHGCYLLLLFTAWRSKDCCLPDDDKLLARYAKLGPIQWQKIRPIMEAFFTIENGIWVQRRLKDERVAVKQRRNQNIKAGKASALKRHVTVATSVQPEVNIRSTNPSLNLKEEKDIESFSSPPIPPETVGASSPKKPTAKFTPPPWVPEDAWSGFVEMRRKGKSPFTLRAQHLAIETLDKLRRDGHDPSEVLNQSVMRGWQGLFPVKPDFAQQGQAPPAKKSYAREMQEAAARAVQNTGGLE